MGGSMKLRLRGRRTETGKGSVKKCLYIFIFPLRKSSANVA